jgi:hypothetical protein
MAQQYLGVSDVVTRALLLHNAQLLFGDEFLTLGDVPVDFSQVGGFTCHEATYRDLPRSEWRSLVTLRADPCSWLWGKKDIKINDTCCCAI